MVSVVLDHGAIAVLLEVSRDRINCDLQATRSRFQHRKRGVETKIILAGSAAPRDETLFRNIARANTYFAMIKPGKTFAEVADIEGISSCRIQQLIELTFLAPDVIRDVFDGRQPIGLTTEWLQRHAYSPIWQDQRAIFRAP